jgi:ribosomal protein S13
MDVDPLEHVEDDEEGDEGDDKSKGSDKPKSNLNRMVAVTVALLATFLGICNVKDNNIVQAMQQAQADKIDSYSWYQARNIREEVARATAAQLTAQLAATPADARAAVQQQIDAYNTLAKEQSEKKKQQQDAADQADATYNQLNLHDDQFDLADAALSIAISLLAVTALTQKRWLYYLALVPTAFGLLMGLAGLFGWALHPDALARLLS